MTLHPHLRALREQRERDGVAQLYTLSVAQARKADLESIRAGARAAEPVAHVADLTFAGPDGDLPVRVYRPASARALPVVVYFFGGGWTLGSIDTADGVARRIANAVPAVVVVPGYRLAPEHPFPAAVEDCYAAVRWVAGRAAELGGDPGRIAELGGDPGRIVVAGDSAGGNLAAVVALLGRDRGGPPLVGQVLVYPNTDHTADDGSLRANADPWLFNATSVAWYRGHYLTDPAHGLDPRASPALATDHSGLPPALVVTAEHDPLRDQGERYAATLAGAGVPTELLRYDGMAHGFFTMTGTVDAARQAQETVAATLRRWFSGTAG
jgi:acetyl esterase